MNFYKRNYQPILRYLYTEAIKRQGEISLHKHLDLMCIEFDPGMIIRFVQNKNLNSYNHYKTI